MDMWRSRITAAGEASFARLRGALVEVARSRGLSAVTFDSIAWSSGVAKSSIQFHFRSRLELRRAVLDAWHEALEREIDSTDRFRLLGVRRLWLASERFAGVHAVHTLPMELLRDGGPPPDPVWMNLRAQAVSTLHRWADFLREEALIASEEGHLRPCVDPSALADRIFHTLMGFGWRLMLTDEFGAVTQIGGEVWDTLATACVEPPKWLPPRDRAILDFIDRYRKERARRPVWVEEAQSSEDEQPAK